MSIVMTPNLAQDEATAAAIAATTSQLQSRIAGGIGRGGALSAEFQANPTLLAGFARRFAKAMLDRDSQSMCFILGDAGEHAIARGLFSEMTGVQLHGNQVDDERLLYEWEGLSTQHIEMLVSRRSMEVALRAAAPIGDTPESLTAQAEALFDGGYTECDLTPGKEAISNPELGARIPLPYAEQSRTAIVSVIGYLRARRAFRIEKAQARERVLFERACDNAMRSNPFFL